MKTRAGSRSAAGRSRDARESGGRKALAVSRLPRRRAFREEGAEPARIPTSLTATLREQGPRYLHRMSRRMRRKMRAGGPAPAPAERPAETTREVQAPEVRSEAKPEPQRAPGRASGKIRAAVHQRSAARGAGDYRTDRQGATGPKGSAHHIAYRAAGPFSGLHAHGGPRRCFAQDPER